MGLCWFRTMDRDPGCPLFQGYEAGAGRVTQQTHQTGRPDDIGPTVSSRGATFAACRKFALMQTGMASLSRKPGMSKNHRIKGTTSGVVS